MHAKRVKSFLNWVKICPDSDSNSEHLVLIPFPIELSGRHQSQHNPPRQSFGMLF